MSYILILAISIDDNAFEITFSTFIYPDVLFGNKIDSINRFTKH